MTSAAVSGPHAAGTSSSQDELAVLQVQFPCFRIWREQTCDRARYVARSLHRGMNPYIVVTDDLDELRAALEPSRQAACPRPHPAGHEQPYSPPASPFPATAS
jgi:hypothetical protein